MPLKKTLDNGDESYWPTSQRRVYKVNTQKIDSGVTTGLEEAESMLVGQFKRAQSEFIRVKCIQPKNYHRRFEKKTLN
jgi:hypothetical protein